MPGDWLLICGPILLANSSCAVGFLFPGACLFGRPSGYTIAHNAPRTRKGISAPRSGHCSASPVPAQCARHQNVVQRMHPAIPQPHGCNSDELQKPMRFDFRNPDTGTTARCSLRHFSLRVYNVERLGCAGTMISAHTCASFCLVGGAGHWP